MKTSNCMRKTSTNDYCIASGHHIKTPNEVSPRTDADTAADMTTRCTFKNEDPSRGPGRVHVTAPDKGFGLEGTPKAKIQRKPSPQSKPYIWAAAVNDVAEVIVEVSLRPSLRRDASKPTQSTER